MRYVDYGDDVSNIVKNYKLFNDNYELIEFLSHIGGGRYTEVIFDLEDTNINGFWCAVELDTEQIQQIKEVKEIKEGYSKSCEEKLRVLKKLFHVKYGKKVNTYLVFQDWMHGYGGAWEIKQIML